MEKKRKKKKKRRRKNKGESGVSRVSRDTDPIKGRRGGGVEEIRGGAFRGPSRTLLSKEGPAIGAATGSKIKCSSFMVSDTTAGTRVYTRHGPRSIGHVTTFSAINLTRPFLTFRPIRGRDPFG